MGDPNEKYKRTKKFRNPIIKEINKSKEVFRIKPLNPKKKCMKKKITINNYEDFNEEN